MLYWLFDALQEVPGLGVFQFLTFRAVLAAGFSLVISLYAGKQIILLLRRKVIGESIRKLGPDTHKHKAGTPTMGGLIIVTAIVVPSILWSDLSNAYVWLAVLATLWMGLFGFLDDYIKVFRKNKAGLHGMIKIAGQVGLGLIVGIVMVTNEDFSGVNPHIEIDGDVEINEFLERVGFEDEDELLQAGDTPFDQLEEADQHKPHAQYLIRRYGEGRLTIQIPDSLRAKTAYELFGRKDPGFATSTNIPFLKNEAFDYGNLAFWTDSVLWSKLIYVALVIFIVTAVSNGVNITDGLDGLAAGTSAIVGALLGLYAYLSGNLVFADYLNIFHIPMGGELFVFCAAFVGACIGFLWFNAYPAQIFMGDTGSLALGGAIGTLSLMVKKELLLPIFCGIFFVESLSVILQVGYYKYTRSRYGEGKRLLRMSPLHHHYELGGWQEPKIVTRFWIVSILLILLAFATIKLR
jgi:phospho-N-acetylmuramoyl-pentapeptide-transferase